MHTTYPDHQELERLTGTSTFAYDNEPEPAHFNRNHRRAMKAMERRQTRQAKRQLHQLVRGGIYGDEQDIGG